MSDKTEFDLSKLLKGVLTDALVDKGAKAGLAAIGPILAMANKVFETTGPTGVVTDDDIVGGKSTKNSDACTMIVNGVTISTSTRPNILIVGDSVLVNGVKIDVGFEIPGKVEIVCVEGSIGDLTAYGNVNCTTVNGDVTAHGNVDAWGVNGDITATGNVKARNISGDVICSGNVKADSITGDVSKGR